MPPPPQPSAGAEPSTAAPGSSEPPSGPRQALGLGSAGGRAPGSERLVVAELARRLDRGEAVVAVTAVAVTGSPPCRPGQKLLLTGLGPVSGTLGCSELDSLAQEEVGPALASGEPRLRRLGHADGVVEVYVEPFPSRGRLVVLSATPVAAFVLRWATDLEWDTVLIDPRPGRLTGDNAAAARSVRPRPDDLVLGPGDAVVATDHDAPELAECLAWALRQGAGYVGLMGSARHVQAHLEALAQAGLHGEELARLNTPVGLDLGGRRAPEIALSILAGVVAWDHQRPGGWLAPLLAGQQERPA